LTEANRDASRLPSPVPPTRYPTWSAANSVKAAFEEHLRATQEPETFPGLAHYKPPRKDAPFVLIVKEFGIDLAKRPGREMIRCAACNTAKKFITGSLAYYPEEEVLRVIGNECGDARRAEANTEYAERIARKSIEDHLLRDLPQIGGLIARAEAVRPAAEHAQQLSSDVRRKAKTFCRAVISEAKAGNGVLSHFVTGLPITGSPEVIFFAPATSPPLGFPWS
jgi:hypothetical protein